MSESDPKPDFDPARAWRDWFVQNERGWSEAMANFMKKDDVSQAMGKEINAAVLAQHMMSQGMTGPMAMMNMPTREDVIALSERIRRLEDAVARIEAALTTALDAGATKPARTRKPPRGKRAPE